MLKRNKMLQQDPSERNKNFKEVALGYDIERAMQEAKRCLNCKTKPCVSGCPVGIDIPSFIKKVSEGDIDAAYGIIDRSSSLPAVCGRVCPQETQCEGKCIRGIKGDPVGIGYLERFVADNHSDIERHVQSNGHKVAVIGSGPAGLSCAGELAKNGYEVLIFEALHKPGGVLVYGIPEFRLPKKIVEHEIDKLKSLGVKIFTNTVIGRTLTIQDLVDMYHCEYIFISTGAGLPRFMNIPGENLKGVYSANEFLTRVNLMRAYEEDSDTFVKVGESVAVVGGGNVAMDAARCAKRLGAKHVYIIYRRSGNELPARREEVEHAKEEGIEFRFLTNPVEISGTKDGFVKAIKCIKMELQEPDESGRRKPIAVKDSEHKIECDCVIMSIGTSANPIIASATKGLKTDKRGYIVIDDNGLTSMKYVYAGGDAVTGAATVILAMGAGKKAARSIMNKFHD